MQKFTFCSNPIHSPCAADNIDGGAVLFCFSLHSKKIDTFQIDANIGI
jgi:hypothetical protein